MKTTKLLYTCVFCGKSDNHFILFNPNPKKLKRDEKLLADWENKINLLHFPLCPVYAIASQKARDLHNGIRN